MTNDIFDRPTLVPPSYPALEAERPTIPCPPPSGLGPMIDDACPPTDRSPDWDWS